MKLRWPWIPLKKPFYSDLQQCPRKRLQRVRGGRVPGAPPLPALPVSANIIPVLWVHTGTKTQRFKPIVLSTCISISSATQICFNVLVPNTYTNDIKCVWQESYESIWISRLKHFIALLFPMSIIVMGIINVKTSLKVMILGCSIINSSSNNNATSFVSITLCKRKDAFG